MGIIYFIVVPVVLITVFILANLYSGFSKYYGNAGNFVSFLTAMLTYLYVVLTGKMVRQMIKNAEDESRPYIIADFEYNERIIHLVIKNIGKLPARNVVISIEPDIEVLTDKKLNETLFAKPLSLIPPGNEIKTFVGMSNELLKGENPKEYTLLLKYNWGKKASVEEIYILDLSYFKSIVFVERKTIHDLAKSIDGIRKDFSSVVKNDGIHIKTTDELRQEYERRMKFFQDSEEA